jgi:hypothetical protein
MTPRLWGISLLFPRPIPYGLFKLRRRAVAAGLIKPAHDSSQFAELSVQPRYPQRRRLIVHGGREDLATAGC